VLLCLKCLYICFWNTGCICNLRLSKIVSDGSLEPLLITFSLAAENINLFTASECLISFLYLRICCKPLSDCPATWNNIQECPVSQRMLDSLMWPNLRKASTYSGQRHQALFEYVFWSAASGVVGQIVGHWAAC
jgi:hypothetical protein